ncbi:MAG: hypothetical protein A2Y60_04660 [Chloroflexi bacterium RBG_13_54_9]|nr:MAG: hypothetical protein A2Y60_04660 [Chloroflexi bacterium RBG_13_54_9]
MDEGAKETEEGTAVAAETREPLPDGGGQRSSGGEERLPVGRRRSAYATRDLTSGSIPRNLWFLGWPQVAEGALNVVDQIADLIWAGRGFGTRAIAGLGAAQSYTSLMMTGRMGLDTAMRAMISRAVGAGNIALANHVALQAFTLSGAFSLIMVFIGVFFTMSLLRLLGISEEVIAQGAPYMRAQFIGMASQAFRMMSGTALQASGDALTPMKATTVTRVAHIILAPFFAFGWWWFPSYGLMGLALANILAQFLGVAMNFYALFTGTSRLHLTFRGYRLDFRLLWQLIKIGAPASVTSMERSIAQIILIGLIAPFGDYALAAYSLTRRIEMFSHLGSQGLGQASGILVGQNLGAGKPQRAKQTVLWAVGYVVLTNAIFAGIIFFFQTAIISIFNRDPALLPAAQAWLGIMVIGFLFHGMGQVFSQSFNTAGDTIVPMVVALATIWGIQQPLAFFLPKVGDLGQVGIAWAIVIALAARPFFYVPYFFWGRWLRVRVFAQDRGAGGAFARVGE